MKASAKIFSTNLFTLFVFGIFSLSIISCVEIRFEVKQPVNSNSLSQFPSELQGKYVDSDCDTLLITECCLTYGNSNTMLSVEHFELEKDTFELTRMDGDYFLNFKAEKHWQVVFLKIGEQSFSAYYIDIDTLVDDYAGTTEKEEKERLVIDRINKITKVRKFNDDDDSYYLINPSVDQLKKLISTGVFIKIDEFKRI